MDCGFAGRGRRCVNGGLNSANGTISARAALDRHGGVDATSAQVQVEDLPRKEKAAGWEEADRRDTSTTEPGANGVSVGILSHV